MSSKARDTQVTHKIMSAFKSKDTRPELMLRKALWHENMRYRVNFKNLPGKPDIVFTKYKIVVFVDGDFWHGHNWVLRGMSSVILYICGIETATAYAVLGGSGRQQLVCSTI